MNRLALTGLCLGFFMVIIDATIINVALPSIASGLDTDVFWLQWIVAGYILTFASLLLTAGYLSDRQGARRWFQIGVVAFMVTSLLCGLAPSARTLTLFRLLQGASASLMVPASLALLHHLCTEDRMRAKVVGIWGATGGVAAAAGPVLGSLLTAWIGWRAIFFVNLLFGGVCLYLTCTQVSRQVDIKHDKAFDLPGQVCGTICIAALAFALIAAGRYGWLSVPVGVAFLLCAIMLAAFVTAEKKSVAPMIPLPLFRHRNFVAAMIVGLMMNVAFYGALFSLPLYFERLRDYPVSVTGFALLPLMLIAIPCSWLSGKLAAHIGPKRPMLIGLTAAAIGMFALRQAVVGTEPYWHLVLPFVIAGAGMAFTMPAATLMATRAVEATQVGMAAGAFNTARQTGSLIGVSVFGSVIAATPHLTTAMHVNLLLAAGAYFCGLLITLTATRSAVRPPNVRPT